MQLGESSYKQCSECDKFIEFRTGPFFVHHYGLTEWSDGETFQELPNLKETKLQRCPHCKKFYWFKQKLGGLTFNEYYEALLFFEKKYSTRSIKDFLFPNLDKYFENKHNLLYIRLNILRTFNDRIRIHPLRGVPDIKQNPINKIEKIIFLENAQKLIKLLEELEPNNYILISELYRNLGLFEKSKNTLKSVEDENIKFLLLNEIKRNNRDVIILKQPLVNNNFNFNRW